MTNQSIVTAPILGFVAFVFSVLPVTTAKAECQTFKRMGVLMVGLTEGP
jgi:hypothetical protein